MMQHAAIENPLLFNRKTLAASAIIGKSIESHILIQFMGGLFSFLIYEALRGSYSSSNNPLLISLRFRSWSSLNSTVFNFSLPKYRNTHTSYALLSLDFLYENQHIIVYKDGLLHTTWLLGYCDSLHRMIIPSSQCLTINYFCESVESRLSVTFANTNVLGPATALYCFIDTFLSWHTYV